jgi:hypothetical protein
MPAEKRCRPAMDLLLIVIIALLPRPMMLASQPVSGSLGIVAPQAKPMASMSDILWFGDTQQAENFVR